MYPCFKNRFTICPRSRDSFYIVSYYIKWITTSWTHSTMILLFDISMVRSISLSFHPSCLWKVDHHSFNELLQLLQLTLAYSAAERVTGRVHQIWRPAVNIKKLRSFFNPFLSWAIFTTHKAAQ